MEKEMAFYSSILAWEILQTEKTGGLHGVAMSQSDKTEHTLSRNSSRTKHIRRSENSCKD